MHGYLNQTKCPKGEHGRAMREAEMQDDEMHVEWTNLAREGGIACNECLNIEKAEVVKTCVSDAHMKVARRQT